jgi:hypothetical protein
MSSSTNLALLLSKTPQEMQELHSENSVALAKQRKVKTNPDSFRQTFTFECERAKKLPADSIQYVYFG